MIVSLGDILFKAQIKLLVLKKLNEDSYSGYDLMSELEEYLGKKPSPGYIYPLLKDLKDKKLIKETKKGKKNNYCLSVKGKKFLIELIKKKKEAMENMIDGLKTLSTKTEIRKIEKLCKEFKKGEDNFHKDSDIFMEFKQEIAKVMNKNYNKKRNKFRVLMKKTIIELKKLNKK